MKMRERLGYLEPRYNMIKLKKDETKSRLAKSGQGVSDPKLPSGMFCKLRY